MPDKCVSHSYEAAEWADAFRAWFEDMLKRNNWTRNHFGEPAISNLSLAFETGWNMRPVGRADALKVPKHGRRSTGAWT
jgi:hypothetical protein